MSLERFVLEGSKGIFFVKDFCLGFLVHERLLAEHLGLLGEQFARVAAHEEVCVAGAGSESDEDVNGVFLLV